MIKSTFAKPILLLAKTSIILFFLILNSTQVFSQATITGEVYSQEQEVQAYANVLLLSTADSSLVKGAITDDEGKFIFEKVVQGEYLVSISMIGFETSYSSPLIIDKSGSHPLGKIIIESSNALLDEVQVVARKPLYEIKIDRMVINVQNSITLTGGNALDVLARSPGIDVNEVNSSISLNGKSDVLVMINGKASPLGMADIIEMLRGMSASNIDKIELFSTPPAHLDAEGTGGVINILMLQNKDFGTNGSYSLNAGYGRRFKYGGSINLNYRKNKLNLYGSYSLRHTFNERIHSFSRSVTQNGEEINTDAENNILGEILTHSARFGLDYDISDKTVLGLLVSGFNKTRDYSTNNFSAFSQRDSLFKIVENINTEENDWTNTLINFNIHQKLKKGESISFDVDYLNYTNNNPSYYLNDFLDGQRNLLSESEISVVNDSPIKNISTKIDYSKKFKNSLHLSMGIKGAGSRFDNVIDVQDKIGNDWVKNETFSQDYEFKEDILAAYTSVSFQLDEQTSVNAGLRYEYTDYLLSTPTDPTFLDLEFDNFFPSFFISRKINDINNIQFSYSRRISRPAFNELAPFVSFVDPNTFFRGNPNLLPGISNSITSTYRFKSIILSAQYAYTENSIVTYQPTIDEETNTQTYTTLNLDKEHYTNFSLSFPYYPTKWWEIQSKVNGGWEKIILEGDANDNNLITKRFIADMTHSFILPNDFVIELTGQYKTPGFYGLLEVQSKGFVNFGLQKKTADGSTIRFSVSDIFRTNVWRSKTDIPELNLLSTLKIDNETRVFRLSYSARFGNSKVKNARRRSTSSEDQRRRVY